MIKPREKQERIDILKAMHTIMLCANNENVYYSWVLLGVPDEPDDDDYESIAEDYDNFKEVVEWFDEVYTDCIHNYGLYIGRDVYLAKGGK